MTPRMWKLVLRLAVSAGGGTAENVGYVQALVGKLQFDRGDYGAKGSQGVAGPFFRRRRHVGDFAG